MCYDTIMIYIVTALASEAKPLIDFFTLQKSDDPYFSIFKNDSIMLIISGMGKLNSTTATTYLLTVNKIKPAHIINIGISGSANPNHHIGECFLIRKIIDHASHKVIHLNPKAFLDATTITCFDTPQNDITKLKNTLVDMESFGFYQSSQKFLNKEQITLFKIVSDKISDTILSPHEVNTLILPHLPLIQKQFTEYLS